MMTRIIRSMYTNGEYMITVNKILMAALVPSESADDTLHWVLMHPMVKLSSRQSRHNLLFSKCSTALSICHIFAPALSYLAQPLHSRSVF